MREILWNLISSIAKIFSSPFLIGASVALGSSILTFTLLEVTLGESNLGETFFVRLLETNGVIRLDTISNILGITAAISGALLLFISILRTVRSASEKKEQEIASRFNVEEKELRRQIEKERDEEKKQALEIQALVLHQEYESLLSENLQKKDGKFVTDWREVLLVARKRLSVEQQRLRTRNAVNLTFGVVGLLAGLSVLIYFRSFTVGLGKDYSFVDFLIAYWSRVSIVITIGVFAGFFLRLYALTERVIERNKNEMTNIELRLTSGLMLYDTKNKDNFAILADTLSKEERNFILGKNESSGGIDPSKLLEIIKATK